MMFDQPNAKKALLTQAPAHMCFCSPENTSAMKLIIESGNTTHILKTDIAWVHARIFTPVALVMLAHNTFHAAG